MIIPIPITSYRYNDDSSQCIKHFEHISDDIKEVIALKKQANKIEEDRNKLIFETLTPEQKASYLENKIKEEKELFESHKIANEVISLLK